MINGRQAKRRNEFLKRAEALADAMEKEYERDPDKAMKECQGYLAAVVDVLAGQIEKRYGDFKEGGA